MSSCWWQCSEPDPDPRNGSTDELYQSVFLCGTVGVLELSGKNTQIDVCRTHVERVLTATQMD